MSEPAPELVDALFDRLSALPPEAREPALETATPNPELRAAVRKLLAYYDDPPPALRESVLTSRQVSAAAAPERIGPYEVVGTLAAVAPARWASSTAPARNGRTARSRSRC